MALSRDEKTLYVTNVKTLVLFDIKPDGTTSISTTLPSSKAAANGDGRDHRLQGRLYVTSGDPGIQVFSAEGKYLGIILCQGSSLASRLPAPARKSSTPKPRA